MQKKTEISGYLSDESGWKGNADQVLIPETVEELATAAAELSSAGLPFLVQGARTGISGSAVPENGTILSTEKLTGISEIREESGHYYLEAECGATLEELRLQCRRYRNAVLRIAPNPTEGSATIGGAVAMNAKGINHAVHGSIGDKAERLTVVTSKGDLQELTDPDLLSRMAGSEGRNGTILSVRLRLDPAPAVVCGLLLFFSEENDAVSFCDDFIIDAEALCSPHILSCAEYLCPGAIRELRAFAETSPGAGAASAIPEHAAAAVYLELESPEEADQSDALMGILGCFLAHNGQEEDTWAVETENDLGKLNQFFHSVIESSHVNAKAPYLHTSFTLPGCSLNELRTMIAQHCAGTEHFYLVCLIDHSCHVHFPERTEADSPAKQAAALTAAAAAAGASLQTLYGTGRIKKDFC